ncbi:hypothetical protein [Paenibacillus sp. Y412MC10]|uniref:hypothetical protein n=1 Tax=Geobacillus sp. (strain Y412MC10) TaxID=481743 RepID=UPI0021B2C800|nr:hypothetical protein [Paenibacillus sp. Y412MC10]
MITSLRNVGGKKINKILSKYYRLNIIDNIAYPYWIIIPTCYQKGQNQEMKKLAMLIAFIFILTVTSACEKTSDQLNSSQALQSNEEQPQGQENKEDDDLTAPPNNEEATTTSHNSQQEDTPNHVETQPEHAALDIPTSDSLMRSPEEKNLSQVEWKPGEPDVTLPLRFGTTEAELVLGLDHPNGTKAVMIFPSTPVGWQLDLSGETGVFDEYGELQEGYKIQAALHDFDQDGISELIVTAGDSIIDLSIWVYSFTTVGDLQKINPIKQELSITGQRYIEIDGDEIIAPYGSQGLFEYYKYVDKVFMQPVY